MKKLLIGLATAALTLMPTAAKADIFGDIFGSGTMESVQHLDDRPYTQKYHEVWVGIGWNNTTGHWAWTAGHRSRVEANTAILDYCDGKCEYYYSYSNQEGNYITLLDTTDEGNGRFWIMVSDSLRQSRDVAIRNCVDRAAPSFSPCDHIFTIRNIPAPPGGMHYSHFKVPNGRDRQYDYYFGGQHLNP